MIYLQLCFEFLQVGLFSVGGGLATIPFLRTMGMNTGWFTEADLANMIAVAESTPGPIGVNMATYVGYQTAGILGSLIATLALITPSIIIILIIANVLQKFRQSNTVTALFFGLRPASVALITSAGIGVAMVSFCEKTPNSALVEFRWGSILLAVSVFACMKFTPLKKLHPIAFIATSALIGIIFKL